MRVVQIEGPSVEAAFLRRVAADYNRGHVTPQWEIPSIIAACLTDMANRRENVEEHIMQFFKYDHLPAPLQTVSAPFSQLAVKIFEDIPRNPERTVALRKLLEAKDAAVRAFIAK